MSEPTSSASNSSLLANADQVSRGHIGGEPAGTIVMSAGWTLEDGELRFFDIRAGRLLEWGSKPWTKID